MPALPPRRSSALPLAATVLACLGAAPLPTVPHVDLGRYSGTWYEVARLPNVFQRNCSAAKAVLVPRADGAIDVTNCCVTPHGRCRSARGTAEPVPCSGNARLRVRFDGLTAVVPVPRAGNYWIIGLDSEYEWAMVGTPDRRFLWILARSPRLDAAILADLRARARDLGFPVDRLVVGR